MMMMGEVKGNDGGNMTTTEAKPLQLTFPSQSPAGKSCPGGNDEPGVRC